jgi:arylamine N-acetyltransferase
MKNQLLDTKAHFQSISHFCEIFKIKEKIFGMNQVREILRGFSHLPYENLSKIIKLNNSRDSLIYRFPEEVISDYAEYKLGGTCFSLTFLLKTVLDYYGYKTYIVMCDMKAYPNSHCTLILKYNSDEYLLDPGYLIHDPLKLINDSKIAEAQNSISLNYNPIGRKYSLWTFDGKRLKFRYSFRKVPISMKDFDKFWKDSFHWRTMHGICLSKRDENGFVYLHNHYVKKEDIKENFNEDIPEIVEKLFNIPPELVKKAEKSLKDNIFYDREMGYKVPKWAKSI